jgi:hypothetical protein
MLAIFMQIFWVGKFNGTFLLEKFVKEYPRDIFIFTPPRQGKKTHRISAKIDGKFL